MKRLFDLLASFFGLLFASPILVPAMILVWLQDFKSPFYIAPRVARGGGLFSMVKLRSMVVNADKTGVASTSNTDMRITPVGQFIRRYKLDELTQLWNVFTGSMSLVGPRPQVQKDVDLYTEEERGMLKARPGITDFASIVFSDEGDILSGHENPDLRYNQVIRPWKSRLALFYIEKQSFFLDIKLILLTIQTILNREKALTEIQKLLESLGAEKSLVEIAGRQKELLPHPPPGASAVVTDI